MGGAASGRVARLAGTRARLAMTALAVGLAAAGLAACGGKGSKTTSSSTTASTQSTTTTAAPPIQRHELGKAAYASAMRGLGRKLARSVEGMYPIADSGTGSANAEELAKVEQAKLGVESVRASLRAIIAPSDVRSDHAQLVQAVGALEDELGNLVVVLNHPLAKPLGQYFKFAALQRVSNAVADIRKKGYAIG